MLNEAFLERFPVTFEQEYPAPAVEAKILMKVANAHGVDDDNFISRLVDWGDIIRKTFYDGGIDESSAPVVWFTLFALTVSSKIKQRQFSLCESF